jgi:protoporphyrin/coproporphyrin ferrochelatase
MPETQNAQVKRGLLLLNLGTPDSPRAEDVGRYLKEFLMDAKVVDIPWLLRWFFVNVLIVPKRKHASAEAYEKIWTERGSPLLFHLQDLKKEVLKSAGVGLHVEMAMRYGKPSVNDALKSFEKSGVDEIIVFPLYPQFAESSTLSSQHHVRQIANRLGLRSKLRFVPAFYDAPDFISAFAQSIGPVLENEKPDHLLMSFHGLPERHIKRLDMTGQHCFQQVDCCEKMTPANQNCYRAQSFATARALAKELSVSREKYTVSFQSRLGRTPWIRPFTDEILRELAQKGVRKLAVICPSFVADCLETIEEIGIRGVDTFREAGGESLIYIPCLNSEPEWARAVLRIALADARATT